MEEGELLYLAEHQDGERKWVLLYSR